jgi:hypothetical protein
VALRSERTTMNSNDCTYQPAKRQRLESGHVNKVCYIFFETHEFARFYGAEAVYFRIR